MAHRKVFGVMVTVETAPGPATSAFAFVSTELTAVRLPMFTG
jgi:hypothetical protein